jgi:hypothetical protein
MKKIHKIAMALTVIGTVGLTYAVLLLKGMPEAFEWEEDDDE